MSQLRNIIMAQGKADHIVLPYCFFNESPVPTDFFPRSSWTKVEYSFSYTGSTNNVFCLGARTNSTSVDRLQIQASTQYDRLNTIIDSHTVVYNSANIATRMDWVCDGYDVSVTNEGTTTTGTIPSGDGFHESSYGVCIGGLQNGSVIATTKMIGYYWGLGIWDNNVKIHDVIPVKLTATNVICLYDTIGDFYYPPIEGTQLLEEDPNA